jgi:hypothetical protein
MSDARMSKSASSNKRQCRVRKPGDLARVEETKLVRARGFYVEVLISEWGGKTAAWSSIQEANLYQIRLNDLFDRIFLFVD